MHFDARAAAFFGLKREEEIEMTRTPTADLSLPLELPEQKAPSRSGVSRLKASEKQELEDQAS